MRQYLPMVLELGRRQHSLFPPTGHGDKFGYFELESLNGSVQLRIISSGDSDPDGHEKVRWEHVSASLQNRCPTWDEMCYVKDLFWGEEETIVQFHPKRTKYVNQHAYCLHLWKPPGGDVLLPPSICVG